MTKILRCTCNHPMQDKMHGVGMRVMNYSTKHKDYTCTVCNARRQVGAEVKKK